jgi:beta-aspartyl-dipeptidase (metallo-type)
MNKLCLCWLIWYLMGISECFSFSHHFSHQSTALPQSYFTLITGGDVWAPSPLGLQDIFISGTKIIGMWPTNETKVREFEKLLSPNITRIDATNMIITPGIVDPHIHMTGGGGESGPASRTPWAEVEQLVEGGITTAVGLLGDSDEIQFF